MSDEWKKNLPKVPKRSSYADISQDDLVFSLFKSEILSANNPDAGLAEKNKKNKKRGKS